MSLLRYRRLLKTVEKTFRGDSFALSKARQEVRSQFLVNQHIRDTLQIEKLWRDAEEVEEMLAFNIVQGRLNERGNYGE